jgi:hypothetical protein
VGLRKENDYGLRRVPFPFLSHFQTTSHFLHVGKLQEAMEFLYRTLRNVQDSAI